MTMPPKVLQDEKQCTSAVNPSESLFANAYSRLATGVSVGEAEAPAPVPIVTPIAIKTANQQQAP